MDEKNLVVSIPPETKDLFTENGVSAVLSAMDKKIKEFGNLSGEIAGDRIKIKAFKQKFTKTRTFLEKTGKEFVAEKKAALKIFDSGRKTLRDGILERETSILKPVTEYEEAEKERAEKERQLEIFNMDLEEALRMESLFERERVIAAKEAELAKQEDERKQKEADKIAEKQEKERLERLEKEAKENAEREAKEAIQAEKDRAERIKLDAEEAEKQAGIEKERAVQKAKDDARIEQEEKERKLADIKAEEDRKSANKNHQRRINREILQDLAVLGITEEVGKLVIKSILNKDTRHLNIKY